MSKNCLELTLDNILSICFLCENRMVQFFQRTPKSISLIQSCSYTLLILFQQSSNALFYLYIIRSTMSDHEEEMWVKARHDVTQFYQRRWVKRTTSRQDLPSGDMTISGDPNPSANKSSEDDDVEDDTYMPSPWVILIEKGWQVIVATGQQEMRERLKRKKMVEMVMMELRVMMMRRMKFLMLMRSTPLPTYTWKLQFSGYPST
jgi:hypothetical protein